jgi:hypothetical protein
MANGRGQSANRKSKITKHTSRIMNTNLFREAAPPHAASAEPPGLMAGLVTTLVLGFRKYLKRLASGRSKAISKEEFLNAMLTIKDRMHDDHLALLEKVDRPDEPG